jgi:hypothetical protein
MVTSCTTKLIKQTFYILPHLARYFHFRWYFSQQSSEFAAPRSAMKYLMRKDWNMKSYRPTFTNYMSCWYQWAPQYMSYIAQSFLHVASCSKLLFTDEWTIRRSTRDKEQFRIMTICISRWSWNLSHNMWGCANETHHIVWVALFLRRNWRPPNLRRNVRSVINDTA